MPDFSPTVTAPDHSADRFTADDWADLTRHAHNLISADPNMQVGQVRHEALRAMGLGCWDLRDVEWESATELVGSVVVGFLSRRAAHPNAANSDFHTLAAARIDAEDPDRFAR